jgi:hypothetical protein
MPKIPKNKPSWKVVLSNYRIDEFDLISTKEKRLGRVVAINTFGRNFNRETAQYLQSHVSVFGLVSSSSTNKFQKKEIGLGNNGFLLLGLMLYQYKYKYAIIIPNEFEYINSLNVALIDKKPSSSTPEIEYKFPHDIFLSNHRDIGLNTPIFEEKNMYYDGKIKDYKMFPEREAIQFNILNYGEKDTTTVGFIEKSPENFKYPTHVHSPYKSQTVETPENTPTHASSSSETPNNDVEMDVEESLPKDKGKQREGEPPKPKPKASGSGQHRNEDGEPKEDYTEENPDPARRLFDPDVNRKDTLVDHSINKIGNKYLNEKFRFNVNPKLLHHSPFETDILKKHGRSNTYKKEIDNKVKKLNIYKNFFEY